MKRVTSRISAFFPTMLYIVLLLVQERYTFRLKEIASIVDKTTFRKESN